MIVKLLTDNDISSIIPITNELFIRKDKEKS